MNETAIEAAFHQSVTIGKLADALAKAQAEMGNAMKDSENPHFRSSYADLASIRDASRPIHKHGLAVTQFVLTRPDGSVGVRTVLMHGSGEWMASEAFMKPDKPGPQPAGSVVTYLRRYSLAGALGIAQDDDDAESATDRQRPAAAPPAQRQAPAAAPKAAPKADDKPAIPRVTKEDIDIVKERLATTNLPKEQWADYMEWAIGRRPKGFTDLYQTEASIIIDKCKNGECMPDTEVA